MLTLLDRYILKQILLTLVFALAALCTIFIAVHFMEKMHQFMDSKVPTLIIIQYYIVYLPEVLKILTPVSVLIACLFTIGRLSNNNEITAMKSGGLGISRLIVPVAIFGLILSAGQYFFNGWIVPEANVRKEHLSRVYLNRSKLATPINDLAFRDTPLRNVLIRYYDPIAGQGHNIIIEDYSPQTTGDTTTPKLTQKTEAKRIEWDSTTNNWRLSGVTTRQISSITKVQTIYQPNTNISLNITPKQMEQLNKAADEMTFTDTENYINILQNGGKDTRQLRIEYHAEQALPMANFIVVLLAINFASRKRRAGLAPQMAAAMAAAFAYLLMFETVKPIAAATGFPPELAGWLPNIIFSAAGTAAIFFYKE